LFFRGGGLRLINEMSPMYHSLHFVLLFPTGQLGWHPKLIFGDSDEGEVDHVEDEEQEEGAEQILAPGEESNDQEIGNVVAVRKKRKYISQAEFF
jgi:hypothetical protein